MKMITRAIFVTAGLALSTGSFAAIMAFSSGDQVTSGVGNDCELLGEAVTLNLSKNVEGAYNCDTTNTDIRVMTCHAAGSNKTTTIDCAVVGFKADGTTPIFNDGSNACTAAWSITNYRIFGGSSKGGTVAAQANTASCLTAQPESHGFFANY